MRTNKIILYLLILLLVMSLTGCSKTSKQAYISGFNNDSSIVVEDMTESKKEEILSKISDYQKYEDFYGWIYVTGTDISVPIAQTDDNEYYLRRGFDKIYSMDGTTFVDYNNTRHPDEESNLIIYGHNLNNKKQFSTLFNLQNESVAKQSKIYLFHQDKIYIYMPFASYTTHVDFNYIQTRFRGEEFDNLISEILNKNEINTNIYPTKQDKLITLSTCTNEDKNERFVVQGILQEIE